MNPIQRFFRLLAQEKAGVSMVYLYAIFYGLINLSMPLGIQAIINLITVGQVSTSLVVLITIVLIGVALTGVLQILQMRIIEGVQQQLFTKASFEFAYRLPRIKLESIRDYYPPELMNRFFDVLSIQKGLPKILTDFSTSAIQIIFGLIVLSFYHPFFILFGFLLIFILVAIFYLSGPKGLETSLKESKYKYKVVHWLEEVARTMESFKLTGHSDLPLTKNDLLVTEYLNSRKKHFNILMVQFGSIVFFKLVIVAGLLILGTQLVISQEINLGQFIASEIIILLIINSVEKLILSLEPIYDVLTGIEKVATVTDLPLESDEGFTYDKIDKHCGMNIEAKSLSYVFPGATHSALSNISLSIKAGEKVCIAGFNGSGKSVLVETLGGLYTDYEGQILYNDIPLSNLNLSSLRSFIGDSLSQEDLFEGTIFENIHMGRSNITLENVKKACEAMQLDHIIHGYDDGYQTMVSPGGRNLNKSTIKKIILARGIVENPRLLVLEESFYVLESDEKRNIIAHLTNTAAPWTLIAVSNDAEFAAQCDTVVVLQNGQIIAQGKFNEVTKETKIKQLFKL